MTEGNKKISKAKLRKTQETKKTKQRNRRKGRQRDRKVESSELFSVKLPCLQTVATQVNI
jgi:hypothetical protein